MGGSVGINNTQYGQRLDAIRNQGNAAQTIFGNTSGVNQSNAGMEQYLAGQAGYPMDLTTAAINSAIGYPQQLWSTASGVVSGIPTFTGQGTTTTSSSQSSNPWSGLLGGIGQGLGMAGATALFCFPKGTQVRMSDGSTKSIELIEIGDEIYDPLSGGSEKIKRKLSPHKNHVYRVETSAGKELKTTDSQPILTDAGEFVELSKLKVGDGLAKAGNITSIEYEGYEEVYDVEADGNNVYEVEGIICEGGSSKYWKE